LSRSDIALYSVTLGQVRRSVAFYSILKFFSLAIRAALIFQVLHSIGATHNHGVAFG
jgi:hypothetical protein